MADQHSTEKQAEKTENQKTKSGTMSGQLNDSDKGQHQGQGHGDVNTVTRTQMAKVLDRYGPYQRRLMLLIVLPLIVSGYGGMVVVLTFVSPDHRCRVPGLDNDTFAIQNDAHRALVNFSIPMSSSDDDVTTYSECDVYRDRDAAHANRTLYDVKEACDSWVYDVTDFDNTVVTQFDLVCGDRGFRANYNMIYVLGQLAGSAVSGILCDRFGRKRIFIVGIFFYILVITVSAFPGIPEMMMVYRFFTSFFDFFLYMGLYVLCIEIVGPEERTMAGSLLQIFWCLGPIVAAALGFLIRDWRWLEIAMAPLILVMSYQWILDESPRWLKTKGREREAAEVIRKVMKVNKILTFDDLDTGDKKENANVNTQHKSNSSDKAKECNTAKSTPSTDKKDNTNSADPEREIPNESILKMCKYPNLIGRTGIIFFQWCVISTTYYGLSLNVANLAGSVKLNFMLSALVELPAYFLAWFLLDRLGRMRTHCASMFLAGLTCVATIFSITYGGSDFEWVTILLVMLGKLGISAAFSTVFLMSGELFPTVVRNRSMGASSSVARVATLISPYISDLSLYIDGPMGEALPLVIFGALALAAGLLALCLPETLHRKLPDTIEESANFTKSKCEDPPVQEPQYVTVRL